MKVISAARLQTDGGDSFGLAEAGVCFGQSDQDT